MAELDDLTAAGFSLAQGLIKGQSDPQLSYMWEVNINGGHRKYDYHDRAQLFATQCSIPSRSVEVLKRKYMGESVSKPALKDHTDEIRCTFWDDKTLQGLRYFHNWFNMIYDPQYGRKAKESHIERDMVLFLKDRTDLFQGAKIEFTSAWIREIGEVELSYNESAPLQFDVTFHFSDMLINDVDYSVSLDKPAPGSVTGDASSLDVNSGIGGFFGGFL